MSFFFIIALSLLCGGAIGYFLALSLERKAAAEKTAFSQKMFQDMAQQFRGISMEALAHNHETFLHLAKGELEKKNLEMTNVIKPVKESFDKLNGKIDLLEKERMTTYISLKEQVSSLIDTQKQLRFETANLVKALRTPIVRGRWGEIQLRRVVELAGMLNHCDFFEQQVGADDKGRPDLLVKLPGGRNIIVDAKAPLSSYLEAIETPDEEKKRFHLKEHARVIRAHMTLLGRKSYWDQFQPSPEFVVLFLPAETFFSAALEHDPTLIESGVEERVILATPTTLIALLKSIAYGWRQESLTKDAEAISELGKELYKRLSDMGGHFSKLGKNLDAAVESYNKAIGSLETRVFTNARRFKDLESTKELDVLEPIEKTPRTLQAPEIAE